MARSAYDGALGSARSSEGSRQRCRAFSRVRRRSSDADEPYWHLREPSPGEAEQAVPPEAARRDRKGKRREASLSAVRSSGPTWLRLTMASNLKSATT